MHPMDRATIALVECAVCLDDEGHAHTSTTPEGVFGVDTAGLRDTQDVVEAEGIRRALDKADLGLHGPSQKAICP